jgi:isopenicillin N synthase-like dioxygenase
MVGREVPEDDPDCGSFSTGPNLWPSSLSKEKFQDHIMEYQSRMLALVKNILDILALGLPKAWECPPDVFDSLLDKPSIPMRFLHYAPVQAMDPRQFGGEFASSCHRQLRPVHDYHQDRDRVVPDLC